MLIEGARKPCCLQSEFLNPNSLIRNFSSRRAVVNLVNQAAVLLVNDAPLYLERRRQLAAVNGKLVGEEADASDALVVCERRGEFRNVALYELRSEERRVGKE